MKIYTILFIFLSMLLFTSIAQAQFTNNSFFIQNNSFQTDTLFNSSSKVHIGNRVTNHIWINTLNSQYIDTTKNKINSSAIPAYIPLMKSSLSNPYSAANQIIGTILPSYYFQSAQFGRNTYNTLNRVYPTVPYGYTPSNVNDTQSIYYIRSKF